MVLSETQIIDRLAVKADVLQADLEGSSEKYLVQLMELASMCDFENENVVDAFFTKALERGMANGDIKRFGNVGTA